MDCLRIRLKALEIDMKPLFVVANAEFHTGTVIAAPGVSFNESHVHLCGIGGFIDDVSHCQSLP